MMSRGAAPGRVSVAPMFEGFARQWTPLVPLTRLSAKPARLRVAGQDLVVWRAPDGEVGVLLDQCPHRGVSLALGTARPDGSLACGFHGWEFGPDGACRHIPFNPGARRERFDARALPVVVAGGFVWVFTGFEPTGGALAGPVCSDVLDRADLVRFDHVEEWDCHWTRAMENMLDFPHLPYVHRTTIGRFVRAKQHRHSRLRFDLENTDYGFRFGARLDHHEPSAHLSWWRPHGMSLDTVPEPRMMRLHVWCVPVDRLRTRMILTSVRNFAMSPAASPAFDRLNVTILRQDRAVVESSQPTVVPGGTSERSVPTDRPTLRFRTFYHRRLAESRELDPRG